jgi:inward rectifier potassium channel
MSSNKHQSRPKDVDNSGFSGNASAEGARLINKDGSANLRKTGVPFYKRISLYHTLLKMSRARFLTMVFCLYTATNLVFASIYLLIGIDKLSGDIDGEGFTYIFAKAFFFSSQTLTTVGYGHVAPIGLVANIVASIESFIGIMLFALVTGMFYARFSRPKAYIKFSENFLVSPYKEGRALMFRMATYKNNNLTDVLAQVTAVIHHMENGKRVSRFYPLTLEISKINSLAISWTCVHYINDESPLWQMTERDMIDASFEMMITVRGFDDHFSNTVQQRTSYNFQELIYGAKFIPMYERAESGKYTEVQLDLVNAHEPYIFEEKATEAV